MGHDFLLTDVGNEIGLMIGGQVMVCWIQNCRQHSQTANRDNSLFLMVFHLIEEFKEK